MKTAEDAIQLIEDLPPQERRKVIDYLNNGDEPFLEEEYSDEDIEKILQAGKEAEQGINMSPLMEGKEAVQYLKNMMKK